MWSGVSGQHIIVACYEEGDAASVEVQHRCVDADDISTRCKIDGDSHKIYKGGCTAVTPLRGKVQIVPGADDGTFASGSFAVMPDE